jgi:hypothetical protein
MFDKKYGMFMVAALVVALAHAVCLADVDILVTSGNGSINITENDNSSGERKIQLEVSGTGPVVFRVRAISGTEKIEYIRVKLMTDITIGRLVISQNGGTVEFVREISRLSGGSSTADFYLQAVNISGDLGGPGTTKSGICQVNHIVSVDCGGDINADIQITALPSDPLDEMQGIELISCDGDFNGDITVDAGRLRTLTVGGNIGSATVTPTIKTFNFIQNISADAIWADIIVESSTGALDGNFWHFTTTVGDFNGSIQSGNINHSYAFGGGFSVAGDWNADVTLGEDVRTAITIAGDITAGSTWDVSGELITAKTTGMEDPFKGALTVNGDLLGNLTFGLNMRGPLVVVGDLGSNALVDIGGSVQNGTNGWTGSMTVQGQLLGSMTMDGGLGGPVAINNAGGSGDPAGALVGQIIINGANGTDEWDSDITLGTVSPIVLGPNQTGSHDAPFYDELSANIGGGAVGLVPFELHGLDSTPIDGALLLGTHSLTEVRIRHYGPITLDQTGGLAVKIERRTSFYPSSGGGPWIDVSGDHL